MALVRGPFDLTWNGNTLAQVQEITVDYSQDSSDYSTVQHQTFELDGAIKATVTLNLLASDVAALALVLPQYHVQNGGTLSTGETVNEENGAIDVKALDCDEASVYSNLDINACGTQSQVMRLVNARTKLDGIEIDGMVRTVTVKFVGEPAQDEATVQFFEENSIAVVS
jgi:hypothetical protein